MHGKGIKGWVRSLGGGISLVFGRNSSGIQRGRMLRLHIYLHMRYLLRAMLGRQRRPVKGVNICGMRVDAPSIEALAFLLQTVYMRRDYEIGDARPKPLIIDCGSNIGMSVLYLKHHFPDARILAFEPNPTAFEYLTANVKQNALRDVTLHRKAVANRTETRVFFSDADDDGSLGASLTDRLREKYGRSVVEQSVECIALSSQIVEPVDFLKVDVEGAEQEILEDLRDRGLLRQISKMFVEYHYNDCNPNNRLVDILNILDEAGFDTVIDSKRPPPYTAQLGVSYKCNLFATREKAVS